MSRATPASSRAAEVSGRSGLRVLRRAGGSTAIALGLGIALSCGLFAIGRDWRRVRWETEFGKLAEDQGEVLRRRLDANLEIILSIQNFYASSRLVEPQEFRSFVHETLVRHPEIRALSWAPRVKSAEQAAFEEAARAEGLPGFHIREADAQGRLVPAGLRDEYVPVYYLEPLSERNRPALGFDLTSNPARRSALDQARDTGEPIATPWTELITEPHEPGFLVFLPVYRTGEPQATVEERRLSLSGFVLAVYGLEEFLQACLEGLSKEGIATSLHEGAAEYNRSPDRSSRRWGLRGLEWSAPLSVAGRTWVVTCRATPEFFAARRDWRPWGMLLFGLLFTGFATVYLSMAAYHAVRVERLVVERTAELGRTTRELEMRNLELAQRERAMQSLLEDLTAAKARIEQQASTLKAANTKLKDLAALKDEFVAKVNHELRTPLTSIKEGISLMVDAALGPVTADQQDFLKTMDHDLDRLTELINNMLDLSKIEAGRMRLSRSRVDVRTLITSLMRSYQPILGQRRVQAEAAQVPPVFADSNRMLQVLTNLFSNAIKFTQDDGTITFRVAPRDRMVAVEVQDNGPGIAPEDLPKLFQKFSQVGPQGVGAFRGTGLGLVVCKELAELHGGRIEVASELGRGTTFTVLLPAYSDTFALTESFQDLVPSEDGQVPCVVVVQAGAALDGSLSPEVRREELERWAEGVRRHLHRGDLVVPVDPSWVAVLAMTDASGVQAIVRRLRHSLAEGNRLQFGAALHPNDGADVLSLFDHATRTLEKGLTAAAGLGSVLK